METVLRFKSNYDARDSRRNLVTNLISLVYKASSCATTPSRLLRLSLSHNLLHVPFIPNVSMLMFIYLFYLFYY